MFDWWNSADCLTKLSRWVPYLFIFLGCVVAGLGQYAKTKIDHRLSRWVPYLFIFLGCVVAGLGQYAKTKIDSKIVFLRESAETIRKNTPPSMNVRLGRGDESGKILLEIRTKNEIPFKASWLVVTKDNKVVSPILTEMPEFFPTEENRRFLTQVTINDEKVVDNYIELRFRFESLYSAELNHPENLKGKITRKYGYANGVLSLIGQLQVDQENR